MRQDYDEGKQISGVEITPIVALSKSYQFPLKSRARDKVLLHYWF